MQVFSSSWSTCFQRALLRWRSGSSCGRALPLPASTAPSRGMLGLQESSLLSVSILFMSAHIISSLLCLSWSLSVFQCKQEVVQALAGTPVGTKQFRAVFTREVASKGVEGSLSLPHLTALCQPLSGSPDAWLCPFPPHHHPGQVRKEGRITAGRGKEMPGLRYLLKSVQEQRDIPERMGLRIWGHRGHAVVVGLLSMSLSVPTSAPAPNPWGNTFMCVTQVTALARPGKQSNFVLCWCATSLMWNLRVELWLGKMFPEVVVGVFDVCT